MRHTSALDIGCLDFALAIHGGASLAAVDPVFPAIRMPRQLIATCTARYWLRMHGVPQYLPRGSYAQHCADIREFLPVLARF
jgi:hypothetical protein